MPPAYTTMPYAGYVSQHLDKVHNQRVAETNDPRSNPMIDSYERAKRAVENARRELEEQRRTGKLPNRQYESIYNSAPKYDYGKYDNGQSYDKNYDGRSSPISSRAPAAPSFCTQAQPDTSITPRQDVAATMPRTGYSSYNDWSGAAKRGSTTPRNGRSVSRSPTQPRRSPSWSQYADPEQGIKAPRGATSPRAIAARSPRHGGAKRKILAIDLDETLIHSRFEPCQADLYVPMTMDGQHYTAYVSTRPGFDQFLRKAVELFDVVIWTASLECYAGGVIDQLERISGCGRLKRMFRESCTKQSTGYVKDLRKLIPMGDNRTLCDVAIVDNTPGVAGLQPNNLVHVANYYNDKNDRVLLDVIPILERMAGADNICDAIY